MPRGKSGRGGMGKRNPKKGNQPKRELWYREEGQEYAQVESMLGNGKLRAKCFDGKVRLATIRGKMRRRVYIFVNDIILVGLRDFQDEKCDVIWKYYPEEAKTLKAMGEIPDSTEIDDSKKDNKDGDDGGMKIMFQDENVDENKLKPGEKPNKEPLPMPSDEESSEEESEDENQMMEEKKPTNKPTHTSKYVPQNVKNLQDDDSSEEEEEKEDSIDDI